MVYAERLEELVEEFAKSGWHFVATLDSGDAFTLKPTYTLTMTRKDESLRVADYIPHTLINNLKKVYDNNFQEAAYG